MLVFIPAAGLIAADHENGGDIQSASGHEVRRRCLVAGRQADYSVQLRPLHLYLYIIHDQVTAAENVASTATHEDKIAGGSRPYLEREPTCGPDRILDNFSHTIQMAETDGKLRRAVDHGYLGFFHVFIADPKSEPMGTASRIVCGITA